MFQKALPIFPEGKKWEMNTHIVLRAQTDSLKNAVFSVTASNFYQLFVNGIFVAFGPCRAAGGYARIDEFALDSYHREGKNEIRVEVVGYACRSLSTVYSPSFVCAEITRNGEPVLYTGRDFDCYFSASYLQRTERYSAQRHFTEIYDAREKEPFSERYAVKTEVVDGVTFLPRRSPYSVYRHVSAENAACFGEFSFDETLPYQKQRSSFPIDAYWGRYEEDEIPFKPYRWIQRQKQSVKNKNVAFPVVLRENEYAIFDLNGIQSGMVRFSADVTKEADVVIGFTELCSEEKFEFTDINCQNVLEYFLPVGKAEHMSFEPYTCRLAIVMVKRGALSITDFGVLGVECDTSAIRTCEIDDTELRAVYDAAVRTFAHNASDIYMDCPSRERAGWLCDSYFTGMAEYFFFGKCDVESAFLENFRLYQNDGSLPDGVLPMCYPSDVKSNGEFIPQWNMWYVIEVADHILKRGHASERALFRESVLGVVRFLERYENENGMLEDLPSWNFVEWSKANDWTRNVNYPTNFLYVGVLLAAYALYGDEKHREKALAIREKTKSLAFDGEVFVDNAVRDKNRKLNNTQNVSEAGQYYAMLFGDVNLNDPMYEKLKFHIKDGFHAFAENLGERTFVPVNAFIGRYLRMQTLLMLEEYEILLQNVGTFFSGMAKTTGTLWEYKDGKGSKDHGFASYAAVAIAEALEGLNRKE